MGFDTQKFLTTQFKKRVQDVDVPELATFFGDDEKVKWVVRGLTGQELATCNAAVERNRNIAAILEGVLSTKPEDLKQAIVKVSGGPDVPDDVAKRVSMLVLGSTDPVVDESTAVHLCTNYPIEFYQITNVIIKLTGLGFDPGK